MKTIVNILINEAFASFASCVISTIFAAIMIILSVETAILFGSWLAVVSIIMLVATIQDVVTAIRKGGRK